MERSWTGHAVEFGGAESGAGAEYWVDKVRSIKFFRAGNRRAPYKHLLLLWMIGRLAEGLPSRISFGDAEKELNRLLKIHKVGAKGGRARDPFVRLANDSRMWTVQDSSGDKVDAGQKLEFLRREAVGSLTPEFEEALRDERVRERVVNELLRMQFPESQHEEVLQEVNLGHLVVSEQSPRDPKFKSTVLRAYENSCSFCGYDVRLDGSPVGIDAAHVQTRAKGGPDSIENGLALCVQHHRLFDWGALGLDHDHQILVSEHLNLSDRGSSTRIRELVGAKIRSPLRRYRLPALEHIDWHNNNLFKHPAR